jgi:zinc D-Ala-D-Ala carboxypeptidase
MRDDIPEAIRHDRREPVKSSVPVALIAVSGLVVVAIALVTIALMLWPKSAPIPQTVASAPSASASPSVQAATAPEASPDQVLGHLAYNEAPTHELEPITEDGRIKLRQIAADSYRKMATDAAAAGVRLNPISGFRSVADQNDLFFRVKEERNQAVSKRAEVSAPPGHSEHHTGYAVDIGDADHPDTDLSQSFDTTPAYRWLSENAARYSFEMSFTQGNAQGVSYEPWHWRFVGDRNSLETFYRAQHLKPSTP